MSLPFNLDWMVATTGLVGLGWAGVDHLSDRYWRHESGSAYGASAWATKREIERAGLFGGDGIVLGRMRGKLIRYKTDRHLLTLAPSRSGKGVSSIIPNLLTWPRSAVVIDPKGESAVVTGLEQGQPMPSFSSGR